MATAKKTHTVREVDESNLSSFIEGYMECYVLLDEAVLRLQRSVEDVQSIYYIGDVIGKKAQQVAELQTAYDTLTQLRDMLSDEYFKKLDEFKADQFNYQELRDSLGL